MKLLVATDFNPDSPGGGPAVIRQMLKGFREQGHTIHWWSCRPEEGQEQPFKVDSHARFPIPRKLMPVQKMTALKTKVLRSLWAPSAARHIGKTIQQLQPECVWAIPHNWSILPIYEALLTHQGRAPRFHTTIQDYPDVHGNDRIWGKAVAHELAEKQLALYARAQTRDATSLPMISDLKQRTGKPAAQMLHEGLEQCDIDFLTRSPSISSEKTTIDIAHVGTVLMQKQFSVVLDALAALRSRGIDIRLHLWSAHGYRAQGWFDARWMQDHGQLEHRNLIDSLRSCNWGLVAMSDEEEDSRYNKFSFPTRCISYMAAGLPALVWGLEDSAVAVFTEKHQTGVVLGDAQGLSLAALLEHSLSAENREKMKSGIIHAARASFDAEKMRRTLWGCLEFGAAYHPPHPARKLGHTSVRTDE